MQMAKCIICERRPRRDGRFCKVCDAQIAAEQRRKKARIPVKYLVYRGDVVGLFTNGDGRLKAEYLPRVNPDKLSKNPEVVIRLDTYCQGFTREWIKVFKRTVLALAHA